MNSRRRFLKLSAFGGAFLLAGRQLHGQKSKNGLLLPAASEGPVVISTWNHGIGANATAWEILSKGGRALDAAEAGVRVPEADPENRSVGIGGMPDEDGHVTLDACIMDEQGNCGSVAFLEDILHPVSVARRVMEKTKHIMLVGEGARQFALKEGFETAQLLTAQSRDDWAKWKREQADPERINSENHDTIGLLVLDGKGNLSGACTTSGWAYKLRGRVGDSPIIGAGLFVDNEIGAATATGHGEEVIRVAGSHLVVELMRQGMEPEAACKEAVKRIMKRPNLPDYTQVGFLALRKDGAYGAHAIYKGFNYALRQKDFEGMKDASFSK